MITNNKHTHIDNRLRLEGQIKYQLDSHYLLAVISLLC